VPGWLAGWLAPQNLCVKSVGDGLQVIIMAFHQVLWELDRKGTPGLIEVQIP